MTVQLTCTGLNIPDRLGNLFVSISGQGLDGPLIERLIELPMDIHEGCVNGEIRIRAYDDRTWYFPEVSGLVRCRGVSLHFWDAPDDIHDADMDLVFERDRVYLHGAQVGVCVVCVYSVYVCVLCVSVFVCCVSVFVVYTSMELRCVQPVNIMSSSLLNTLMMMMMMMMVMMMIHYNTNAPCHSLRQKSN